MPDELLTVDQVAEMLKLNAQTNAQTVRNLIDRRELGAVRIGPRHVRVRQSQLDEFLAVGERFYADAAVGADERTLG